jgi:hypothetical protein
MMKKSAMFYGVVVAAFLLLVGIAWYFQKLIQGFANPTVADAFQNMSPEEKKRLCDTMMTQVCENKGKLSTMPADVQAQYTVAIDQMKTQMETMGCQAVTC